jgi:hypothetical protein
LLLPTLTAFIDLVIICAICFQPFVSRDVCTEPVCCQSSAIAILTSLEIFAILALLDGVA